VFFFGVNSQSPDIYAVMEVAVFIGVAEIIVEHV
jgi:hypothetical protein